MKKRILSMLLVIVMVLSVLPVQALADGETLAIEPEFLNVIAGDPAVQLSAKKAGALVAAGWTTEPSESEIATISNDGKLAGLKQGEIKVVATDSSSDWGTKTYKVYQPPVDLKLVKAGTTEEPADTMKVGEFVQLGYTCSNLSEILPAYIITGWSIRKADDVNTVSTEGILEVTSTGMLTAKKAGKAMVRLAMNGRNVTKTIEVLPADPGKVAIEKSAESVKVDETVILTVSIGDNTSIPAKDYTFSVDSSSTGNVSFSRSQTTNRCTVTGTEAGKVKIDVKYTQGDKDYAGSIDLVVDPLSEMSITAASAEMYPNRTLTLTADVPDVKWTSSDTSIATVNETTGEVRSYSNLGPVTITATKDGYKDATYVITVVQNSFRITDASGRELNEIEELKYGDTMDLQVRDGSNTAQSGFAFDPVSGDITITAEGKLTANAKTTTPVEVKATKSSTTVKQKFSVGLRSMTIKDEDGNEVTGEISLYEGDNLKLTAFDGEKALSCNWTSRDTDKFTATNGTLTGVAPTAEGQTVELVVDFAGDGYDRVTFQVKVLEKKPLEKVTIDDTTESPVEIRVGQPRELAAVLSALHLTFAPTDATHKDIEWTSDNACLTIGDVDGKAMLTAHAFGNATVTGTYETAAEKKTVTFQVRTFAANGIQLDSTMPLELICGEAMDLKAVLMDAEGNTLETPVQWRLKDDKVIKNLVDLTANRLTAYPQSTYGFDVELEAFVDDKQVEVLPVTIHVIPRTVNIALKKGEENVTDKTAVLDVKNTDGITIQAEIKPDDARQIVSWQVKDPNGICQYTPSDNSVEIKPVSSQKTGTVTVIATTTDGTSKTAQTTVQIAKMAETLEILELKDAPEVNYLRGGETLRLRTSFDNDKTLTDRGIKWEVTGEGKAYASISEDGVLDIAAVSERTTITVTATAKANAAATDSKEITLCPSVKSIKIVRKDGDTLRNVMDYTSDEIQLGIEVNPEDGYIDSFVWDSSNKAVAEVDSDGVLTLQGVAGKTQITCTADDGSKVRGIYNLEVVMAAGYVDIEGVEELVSGKSATLKATVYSDDEILAGNQRVIWSVEDVFGNATKAASINSRGRLVAKTVNYGTEVVVYAKSVENGEVIGEHHVTILPKKARTFMAAREGEDGTEILGSTLYMNAGESTVIFGQWFTREEGLYDEYDCTYFSSNSGVAKIYEDGALETLKKGSATITVRATDPDTRNVYTAKFTLKVINTVDHIVISKPDKAPYYVRSGERMNLSATVWSNEVETIKADNQGVTWGVFEENGTGLVATGAAYMTSGGTIVANSVTKNTPVVVVATSKENSSIIGEFPLTIRPAKAYTVTARCENEAGDWVVPSAAVSLEAKSGNTYFTDEIRTNVYVSNPNSGYDGKDLPGAAIVWETSNKDIVKVVDGKLVYTGRTGKVKVTPTFKVGNDTYRGNAITLNIVKLVKEDGIEVTKKYANQELYSGKSLVMYANVDKDATIRRVSWSLVGSDDGDVASINASTGLIRARKGLTERYTITVMATAVDGSGVSDTMEVTIYPLTTRVEIITEDDITALEKGETAELTAVLLVSGEEDQANQNAVKWRSSRSSVVYVDKDGNITAKRKGTATIKASATDGSGKYATIKVTVK